MNESVMCDEAEYTMLFSDPQGGWADPGQQKSR
jgi:hypothetical protein